ncbi:hypothetical protein [Phytohabitans rumicis]|uniref:hypothetical protein n=1 Tax=Phytohabitans rumicis TaxID=1076125 RepID=UPI001FEC56CD|nr:hypothetical protein [Phytohabitans rumicis]
MEVRGRGRQGGHELLDPAAVVEVHRHDLGGHHGRQMGGRFGEDAAAVAGDQFLAVADDVDDGPVEQDPAVFGHPQLQPCGGRSNQTCTWPVPTAFSYSL